MEIDGRLPQSLQRLTRDVGSNKRVAVAIATHPRAVTNQRRVVLQLHAGEILREGLPQFVDQRRRLFPQHREECQPACDFIEHRRPSRSDEIGLPEHFHFALQFAIDPRLMPHAPLLGIAVSEHLMNAP